MITIRLLISGESPMMSPVSGLRSGAPGGSVSARHDGEHGDQRPQRPAQALGLGGGVDRRALLALELLLVGLAAIPAPSRGSTILVVTSVITTVRKSVETIPNHRFDTRSRFTLGSTSCAASLAMSVTTPSAGVSRMFTEKAALTAPKPAAMPASGCLPTLMNATAASGISTR